MSPVLGGGGGDMALVGDGFDGDLAGLDLTPVVPEDLAHSGPFLTMTSALAPPAVDLTVEGTADWAHWGFGGVGDFDQKASGNMQISNWQSTGFNVPTQYSDNLVAYRWVDGATGNGRHNKTAGNGTTTGIYVLTAGFKISAPADTTVRKLRVYVGQKNATGQLDASLGDMSAPAATDASHAAGSNAVNAVYTITYASASPTTLDVTWTVKDANFAGTITLQSATLQKP